MEEMKNAYTILVAKPEGKRLGGSVRYGLDSSGSDRVTWRALVTAIMKLLVA
jgi:hypothetical protein